MDLGEGHMCVQSDYLTFLWSENFKIKNWDLEARLPGHESHLALPSGQVPELSLS